jgi:hypothetical protein
MNTPDAEPISSGITREMRQDTMAFLALLRLGKTAEEADAMVAGMQAKRAELKAKPAAPAKNE